MAERFTPEGFEKVFGDLVRKHRPSEEELCRADLGAYGVCFAMDGKRVSPDEVFAALR
jgi:hypothetical protein